MITLKLRTDNLLSPDNIPYVGYGFDVYDFYDNKLLAEIPDVSLNCSDVTDFICLCNASDASYIHIYDLIEDFFL